MKKLLITLILFTSHPVLTGQDYFPAAVGTSWTYRSVFLISVNTVRVTVTGSQVLDNDNYVIFDFYRMGSSIPFMMDQQKVYTVVNDEKALLYDFAAETGDSWEAPDPPGNVSGSMRLISKTDTISTPAGIFTPCYHFHHSIDASNYYDEWFAPDVGLVKRDTRLLSGLIEEELTDYQIATFIRQPDRIEPCGFHLNPCYPNPFNSTLAVSFESTREIDLNIDVFNALGVQVDRLYAGTCREGMNTVYWNGTAQTSGLYIIRVCSNGFAFYRKAVLKK
jgi:hypothetical protein